MGVRESFDWKIKLKCVQGFVTKMLILVRENILCHMIRVDIQLWRKHARSKSFLTFGIYSSRWRYWLLSPRKALKYEML